MFPMVDDLQPKIDPTGFRDTLARQLWERLLSGPPALATLEGSATSLTITILNMHSTLHNRHVHHIHRIQTTGSNAGDFHWNEKYGEEESKLTIELSGPEQKIHGRKHSSDLNLVLLRTNKRIILLAFLAFCALYVLAKLIGWFDYSMNLLLIDRAWIEYNRHDAKRRRNKFLQTRFGLVLPSLDIRNSDSKREPSSPFGALAESLARVFSNRQNQLKAQKEATLWKETCLKQLERSSSSSIPRWILQPNEGEWFRPLIGAKNLMTLAYEESDMRRLIHAECSDLVPHYDSAITISERVIIWAPCVLYKYGGYIFGAETRDVSPLVRELSTAVGPPCSDQAVAIFSKPNNNTYAKVSMVMLASSPRHPQLLCLIRKIASATVRLDASQLLSILLGQEGWTRSISKPAFKGEPGQTEWKLFGANYSDTSLDCNEPNRRLSQGVSLQGKQNHSQFGVTVRKEHPLPLTTVSVTVSEAESYQLTVNGTKLSSRSSLVRKGCFPSWWCNRCLRSYLYGSFESCSSWCSSCYSKNQCDRVPNSKKKVQVTVSIHRQAEQSYTKQLIPRIVHQTSRDEITTKSYPELARIQNSWRNSGYEFRFYNDTTAREYIAKNFPHRFLAAFDSLIPGAFKVRSRLPFLFKFFLSINETSLLTRCKSGRLFPFIGFVKRRRHLRRLGCITGNKSRFLPDTFHVVFCPSRNYSKHGRRRLLFMERINWSSTGSSLHRESR